MRSSSATVVDVMLFKAIGLYQLLCPADRGGYSVRSRRALMTALGLSFALHSFQVPYLYYALNDLQRFAYMAAVIIYGMMCSFKGYVLVTNADRLWLVLNAADYGYTGCGHRDPSRLRRCRATLSALLRTFVALSYGTLIVWIVLPFFVDEYTGITNSDGTVTRYRTTIHNMQYPIPLAVYNSRPVWALIYVTELYVCIVNVFIWSLFDCYLVTMCFVLNAQFHTMSAGYGTLGIRRTGSSPPDTTFAGVRRIKFDEIESNHYSDLISHIQDNQNLIKMFDVFFEVVRPVVLVQIANGSYSVISLIFLTALMYLMGVPVLSAAFLKFICGLISLTIELFIFCYGFNHIETAKSVLNFGIYSSNWTEMDLTFKKTMLLTMKMNSSHKRAMKVSPNSAVGLEMFARVMNMSYSTVSVLLNSRS
ncbi:odorant receptor 2a-like [Acyrthosiphon pisum]|uniref:Odorant receptor n=1 Tax=Acyrthosiphon pisum TaxID=7029 RepID=A0A1S6J144_ACYPI|nr:odorant receptor 2a-like [Acyrthosiphon pisum]AQS60747.1 olfactory receptor 20 protein [Acyrthosiphon pisum]